jgi:hypothetical protein
VPSAALSAHRLRANGLFLHPLADPRRETSELSLEPAMTNLPHEPALRSFRIFAPQWLVQQKEPGNSQAEDSIATIFARLSGSAAVLSETLRGLALFCCGFFGNTSRHRERSNASVSIRSAASSTAALILANASGRIAASLVRTA